MLYLLVLTWGSFRHFVHLHIVLGLLQYGVILPCVLSYLHSERVVSAETVSLPRLNLLAVIGCFALFAIPFSRFISHGLVNPDESGYSFQARIYRSGRVMADPLIGATSKVRETPSELAYANHILTPYGWFSKFPPGWPLVLSLGYLFSAHWLPNAIFGSLQLFVIAAIGSRWFLWETGALAAVLAALSPFYLVNSVGTMSHALCALLTATACLAWCEGSRTGKLRYYAAMFACLASTFQVRPYTGFVLTSVIASAAAWSIRSNRQQLIRVLAVGSLFGALAIAGVLVYNHTYSGKWLVSPYAQAAGVNAPPELSFGLASIWHGMALYGPHMVLETILGGFPFLHVLAGYAIIREKRSRQKVRVLALLYLSLVVAYLAHPEGYAVFFGERFHFEAFFALTLLAARGMQLFVERCRALGSSVIFALVVLGVLQIGHLASTVYVVSNLGESYRKVRAAVGSPDISGLVFLHDGPGFVAKHFNLNEADWRHAVRLYLVDADPERRPGWACRYGFSRWWVVSYDPQAHAATLLAGQTDCSATETQ